MPKIIKITAGQVQLEAQLNDGPTARSIAEALPIKAKAQRWGGEIYFPIPVEAELEDNCREVLEAGELGYWPSGSAFCIFFGATPVSKGAEPVAASPVNVFGRLVKVELEELKRIPDDTNVTIERPD